MTVQKNVSPAGHSFRRHQLSVPHVCVSAPREELSTAQAARNRRTEDGLFRRATRSTAQAHSPKGSRNTEHLPLGVLQNSSATDQNAHIHTPAFRHCLCGNVWSWDFSSTLRNMSKPGCGVHVLLELVTSAMRTSLSFPNSYTKPAIGTTVALRFSERKQTGLNLTEHLIQPS